MYIIGQLLLLALDIYFWIIIISVLASWLIAFDVIKADSPQAKNLLDLLKRVTDPVYKPLRKFVPPIGGVDITPIIVIFGIYALKMIVIRLFFFGPMGYHYWF